MKMIFFAIIWLIGKILLLLYRVDVKGLENLPKHSVLLCPNLRPRAHRAVSAARLSSALHGKSRAF